MEIENEPIRRDNLIKTAWTQCNYCANLRFKELQDFTRHLREKHCTVEGGSFVCHYGYNSVCSSLPVEGVSDSDYAKHIYKSHVFPDVTTPKIIGSGAMNRKLSTSSQHSNSSESSSQWTIYSASQNLAGVLNDPNRGKQKDFFTKTWGVDFVEKTPADIPKHPYLPEVNHSHFESYLRKISKRHKKHGKHKEDSKAGQSSYQTPEEILHLFPKVRLQRALTIERRIVEKPEIPDVFMQPDFDISKAETFYTVFPFAKDGIWSDSPGGSSFHQSGKLQQEKLTHDLDQVEVLIAEQVAQKSDAFFQAMSSHDSLMEQLAKTLGVVKSLRERISVMEKRLSTEPLRLLQLERRRHNNFMVLQKLKLMSTVHQTQPSIQVVLSTPDYVTALDLISTSQELLNHELQGVHSFRHLDSQLVEIDRLIEMMMGNEFEGYCTRDLNRPLVGVSEVLEKDKLVSIMLGMLRREDHQFVQSYRQEAFTTIRTVVKQIVLEALAECDCETEGQFSVEQATVLDLDQWIKLMERVCVGLGRLLRRIKGLHDVMKDTVSMAAGYPESSESRENPSDPLRSIDGDSFTFLSEKSYQKITQDLREMLAAVCDSAHDECAKLLTILAQSKGEKRPRNPKAPTNGNHSILDNVSAKQIRGLWKIIEDFTSECEGICYRTSTPLRAAFQVQANKFINKFHKDRRDKLSSVLESECWRPAEVNPNVQAFVSEVCRTGGIPRRTEFESWGKREKMLGGLSVDKEKYIVVGTVIFLLRLIAEYSSTASDLSSLSPQILRSLAELLADFNSRSCQMVLGAGAMQSVGLKSITTTNLVLTSRALQLLLWLVPFVKRHFDDLLSRSSTQQPRSTSSLLEVESNMKDHIGKLQAKVVLIVTTVVTSEICEWGAKPPVPSVAFRNISKHLTKLHEAVSGVLPSKQIEEVYRSIHNGFKDALREQLRKLNIVNNGGPQHGIVTSELIFYVEMLKKLQVLSSDDLDERSLDVW